MKKTNYFILAAAAALFAACSSDDDLVVQQEASPQSEQAVTFSAYLNRGTTRAGWAGELKTEQLKTTGFGVFGYYTDNELYSESSKPNFMYNQKVSGANWTYSPLKYWPNEYGSDAMSEAQDKLTFFAYAPWVDVVPETGLLKEQSGNNSGIVALTRNTASGDPYVKYMVDMTPSKCVDFCWGVSKDGFTSSVEGTLNSIIAGEVYKNVSKPKVTDKIKFDFNHALASLNVQIDADIDQDVHGDNALAAETKIYVRSVTFEGFAAKGMFNLNANKDQPKWYDLTGNNELTSGKVTIYDGRRDGSEGQINAAAANETPNDLNPTIIQNNPATNGVPSGTDPVNLFNNTNAEAPIYVIPVSNEQLKVTIVYDVETKDENLANYLSDGVTKGSTIENTITKSISSSGGDLKLEAGKKYIVKLHLGMTSVKFDAEVTVWGDGDEGEPWLPKNNGSIDAADALAPTVTAANPAATISATVAASTTTYSVNVTGLDKNETVSATKSGEAISEATAAAADASGNTKLTATLTENNTVSNRTCTATVAGETSGKAVTISITQEAAAIGLTATGLDNDHKNTITLNSTATATAENWSTAVVTMMKGGSAFDAFTWDSANQKVTLTENAANGEVYKITVSNLGDAKPAEVTVENTIAPEP